MSIKVKTKFLLMTFFLIFSCSNPASENLKNNLDNESSEYLKQHAKNPVFWQTWTPSALKKAKELDRPIIISIGYSSCHWCHVMERETFEDKSVAAFMNNHFVSIKIDREESPDVDRFYMTAARLITGKNGGWPLNVIALPDGSAFYAGTYHTKKEWLEVLNKIVVSFEKNRQDLEQFASMVMEGVVENSIIQPSDAPPDKDISGFNDAVEKWKLEWDFLFGGMKGENKFTNPTQLELLLSYATLADNSEAETFLLKTLNAIANSGMVDHVDGGVFRYSTDRSWTIPHFEKMLYDNALLMSVFSKAYMAHKDESYKSIIRGIHTYIQNSLKIDNELFAASQDAESENQEGLYYLYNEADLKAIFKDEFHESSSRYFSKIQKNDSLIMYHLKSKFFQEEYGDDSGVAMAKENRILNRLKQIRRNKPSPKVDSKQIVSWNALTVLGYCDAFLATNDSMYLNKAKKTMATILNQSLSNDYRLAHIVSKSSKSNQNAFLEDYAYVAKACLKLYQLTLDKHYLKIAKQLTLNSYKLFKTNQSPFLVISVKKPKTILPQIPSLDDNVIPSANGVVASNSFELFHLTGKKVFLNHYTEFTKNMHDAVLNGLYYYSYSGKIMLFELFPFYEVVVVGPKAKEIVLNLSSYHFPNTLIVGSAKQDNSLPLFSDRYFESQTLIYVCQDNTCYLPTENLEDAINYLKGAFQHQNSKDAFEEMDFYPILQSQ